MQHSRDRDVSYPDVGEIFADPAFTSLKERNAAFAIVRPGPSELVWANATAAARWRADDAAALKVALLGAADRVGGWLGGMTRAVVPGRPPQLVRGPLSDGFRMRIPMVLIRAWTEPDGAVAMGFAVPGTAGTGPVTAESWRHPAWGVDGPSSAAAIDAAPRTPEEPAPAGDEDGTVDAVAGTELARRSQLAILRDRLNAAVDGAGMLRLLWRTDAADALTQIDTDTFAKLGSPARFMSGTLPDVVAGFDAAGADALRAALARRTTWSGITVALPVAEGAATAPMALSASPTFGPDRGFAGFRGFGAVDLTRLDLAPQRQQAPPTAAETEVDPATTAVTGLLPAEADAPTPFQPETGGPAPRDGDHLEPRPAPPALPASNANVVHLRAFQGAPPGRNGAGLFGGPVPDTTPLPADEATRHPEDAEPRTEIQDPPLGGDAAFLALQEALRARIGATAQGTATQGTAADHAETSASPAAPDGEPGDAAPPDTPPTVASKALDPGQGDASRLLDRLPTALLVLSTSVPVFANPAMAARLGYAAPEDVVRAGGALVPPAESGAAASATPDQDAMPGVRSALPLRDARGRQVILAGHPIPTTWGGAAATLWVMEDAEASGRPTPPRPSDREPVERGSIDGDPRAGELLDRVDDAVALLDADGRIRRLNRRGEAWFGHLGANDSGIGRHFTEMLTPDSRVAGSSLIAEVGTLQDGAGLPPLNRDVMGRTRDGTCMPMLLTLGRLGASGFYATLRDVSAQKRAETERAITERHRAGDAGRLSALIARLNHEIRTPLGAILGFAEVMMDERFGQLGNPRYKDYLKDIHASGTQVVAMVGDLLDLSRIETGQLDLDVKPIEVNRIVSETVAEMQAEAHRRRVIMRTSLAGRAPLVLADERAARRIVTNLLSNAVKFNEPGGQVIISTTLGDNGTVLLRVRDTGVGMTEAEVAAALEPFGGAPLARPKDGNGLGLPLTRALVGVNGASMAIRSRQGEGTLVEVTFLSAGAESTRQPA